LDDREGLSQKWRKIVQGARMNGDFKASNVQISEKYCCLNRSQQADVNLMNRDI
jgi:hypothetical protein